MPPGSCKQLQATFARGRSKLASTYRSQLRTVQQAQSKHASLTRMKETGQLPANLQTLAAPTIYGREVDAVRASAAAGIKALQEQLLTELIAAAATDVTKQQAAANTTKHSAAQQLAATLDTLPDNMRQHPAVTMYLEAAQLELTLDMHAAEEQVRTAAERKQQQEEQRQAAAAAAAAEAAPLDAAEQMRKIAEQVVTKALKQLPLKQPPKPPKPPQPSPPPRRGAQPQQPRPQRPQQRPQQQGQAPQPRQQQRRPGSRGGQRPSPRGANADRTRPGGQAPPAGKQQRRGPIPPRPAPQPDF
jgi:hypothetical protein